MINIKSAEAGQIPALFGGRELAEARKLNSERLESKAPRRRGFLAHLEQMLSDGIAPMLPRFDERL